MNLYEIDAAISMLADPETGEIPDWDAFQALQIERDKKIESMALWLKNLVAESKAYKDEIDALSDRKDRAEKNAARLKQNIMDALCGEKFSTPRVAISYGKSSAIESTDEQQAIKWLEQNGYDDYINYGAPKLKKTELKDLIKSGVPVPLVQIVERQNLRVK
jgi:hypothetical protein